MIVDNYTMIRTGMRVLFQACVEYYHLDEADCERSALALLSTKEYDLLITEIGFEHGGSPSFTRLVRELRPKLPILLYSKLPEDQYALPMLSFGAAGFVSKRSSPEELLNAISTVLAGKKYLDVGLQTRLLLQDKTLDIMKSQNPLEKLSKREMEVMDLIIRGKSTSEIASALAVKTNTVSTLKGRVYRKMRVQDAYSLCQKASVLGSPIV